MNELPVAIPVRDDEPIPVTETVSMPVTDQVTVETYDICAMRLRCLSLVVFVVIIVILIMSVKNEMY